MKFLTKLGQILLKTTQIVTGIAPFIPTTQQDVFQIISKDLTEVANIVVQAEVFGQALGLPGDQKLKAASPAVAQLILQSSLLSGHEISDEVLFKAGIDKITSGMADVLNSFHDDIATESKT